MKKLVLGLLAVAMCLAACQPQKTETFAVGEGSFMLNNQPFVVKAAEIHYPRIPKEYWEHRIQMCKALGMNTICLYIFWNIHEPTEGAFDFTGNNDVAAFCRLAQKHDMYVIVRPGPYVCAEWEMGGLPWWLLKQKDIKLRDNHPYYMERVALFMQQVGKQLADLQLSRGGNILMVQVENEYGAYGKNPEYVAAIRDVVRSSGFNDVQLFQCDWNSNFEHNALPDLLWTINFGTGANIDAQFKRLKELRPETPLMCSEFWSGWFDHWGAPHETRSAEALVDGLREMMEKNISFSLYMTHGGTSFGHWGGANFPNFSPTTTSYDYDAPISEQGRATEKYMQVRQLLGQYLPQGQELAPIPAALPVINLPEVKFTEVAPIFDNLPEPKLSDSIQSMEFFDQGWGSILYRTKLPASPARQLLTVTEAHDWAQVFIDGKKIGTLNRLRGDAALLLPAVPQGAVLDIMVEAMGRMNFGRGIYDWKGITQSVTLKDERGTTSELTGWQVYNLPVDYAFVSNLRYTAAPSPQGMPAAHRATFKLSETGDTFLDMRGWTKGMVYVNGHNLGRFWEIGPQQTLFLPAPFLKKGTNEIIVLDLSSPAEGVTSGLTEPILDMLRGSGAYKHRKPGETLNLGGEKPVAQGSFKPGHGWQTVKFGAARPARYVAFEALSAHDGKPFAAIAELELLGADGRRLSRQHWKVLYADSEEVDAANNAATNVFDLQESTIWHTSWSMVSDPFPHHLVIDLGEDKVISGFEYLPRMEADKPGMIKDYRFYAKETPFRLTGDN